MRALLLGSALVMLATEFATAHPAEGQAADRALCRIGEKVDYAKEGRRYPGTVEGDNGRNCIVYAKAYMGAIDVAYADLRPASDAPEDGRPDDACHRCARTITATPRDIIEAFSRDPDAAKARYVGARIRLSGAIHTTDAASIWFKANLYQTAAVCRIEPADRAGVARRERWPDDHGRRGRQRSRERFDLPAAMPHRRGWRGTDRVRRRGSSAARAVFLHECGARRGESDAGGVDLYRRRGERRLSVRFSARSGSPSSGEAIRNGDGADRGAPIPPRPGDHPSRASC